MYARVYQRGDFDYSTQARTRLNAALIGPVYRYLVILVRSRLWKLNLISSSFVRGNYGLFDDVTGVCIGRACRVAITPGNPPIRRNVW